MALKTCSQHLLNSFNMHKHKYVSQLPHHYYIMGSMCKILWSLPNWSAVLCRQSWTLVAEDLTWSPWGWPQALEINISPSSPFSLTSMRIFFAAGLCPPRRYVLYSDHLPSCHFGNRDVSCELCTHPLRGNTGVPILASELVCKIWECYFLAYLRQFSEFVFRSAHEPWV